MYHILLVEDNGYLQIYEEKNLKNEGYLVTSIADGAKAIAFLKENLHIDLIILDLCLEGDLSGDDVLEFLRNRSYQTPVLVTSTVLDINRKVSLFQKGCDDYIVKPFEIDELVARVKRVLARQEIQKIAFKKKIPRHFVYKDFSILEESLSILKNGKTLSIRKKLFQLLLFFANNPGVFFSIEDIYASLWANHKSYSCADNTVNVHIRHLRKIIEPDPKNPRYLINRRGQGYCFIENY